MADPVKVPIDRDLWDAVHVKYVTETQESISKRGALKKVLEKYVNGGDTAESKGTRTQKSA